MAAKTGISWCDSTFNPWIGCTKVSPACDHCYAERDFDLRRHAVSWGASQPRKRTSVANWKNPVQWNRETFVHCLECDTRGSLSDLAKTKGNPCHHEHYEMVRRRVFCASLADVFDNEVRVQWRRDLFDLINATPNLDWLLLTKRVGNARVMYADSYLDSARPWPNNVWLGATVCNQAEADRDIPKLLSVPAAVRFLSIEPMLGAIDLTVLGAEEPNQIDSLRGVMSSNAPLSIDPSPTQHFAGLDWVICGGESGSKARPMHPDWARSLRDQCSAAGVPFFFKQWGQFDLSYDRDRDDPDCRRCGEMDRQGGRWINLKGGFGFNGERVHYARDVGVKRAGRQLDGREHNDSPGAEL